MHIHILGICGTFMGSLAQLAIAKGIQVTGCDQHVYPPMSDQLRSAGIELIEGYDKDQLALKPDLWIIGNAMSRGNPLVEAILDSGDAYTSGPEFLKNQILNNKWVLAVAGTHGKTSTASMLAWVLEYAGFQPGFLIGGVPANFGISARLGQSDFFVIEADEYDTALFDKRSKFIHYLPRTLILNNLEFDHADIFADLAAIERQFHHLIRTVPSVGTILVNGDDANLHRVINEGCWSSTQTFGSQGGDNDWVATQDNQIYFQSQRQGQLNWTQMGAHNRANALATIAAARSIGIEPAVAIEALSEFTGIKRRMELLATISLPDGQSCTIYDDFAHHPTAIETTLDGLRTAVGNETIVAVIEPRSNSMKMGVHGSSLPNSVAKADKVYWYQPDRLQWSLTDMLQDCANQVVADNIDQLLDQLVKDAAQGGHIVIMSNGGFMGIQQRLRDRLI